MRLILLFLICFLLNNTSVAQLQPIKKLTSNSKADNPVSFSTVLGDQYLYNKRVVTSSGNVTSELWRSDGTESGTVLLVSNPGEFMAGGNVNNEFIFFTAKYAPDGNTLVYDCWKTDGSTSGTAIIKTAVASGKNDGSSYTRRPRNFTLVNNQLFFVANGGTTRQQLWKTDATTVDTVKTDFTGLDYFTGLLDLVSLNNHLYFLIKSPGTNNDAVTLWKSDGSYAGTVPILSGVAQSFLQPDFAGSVVYNGKLIFAATDSAHGRELWITDGTAGGTSLLLDALNGSSGSFPSSLSLIGNKLFFFENYGTALSVYDLNTNNKTSLGAGFNLVYNSAVVVRDKLLFKSVDAQRGFELFVSDGTVSGTALLEDIRKGVAGAFEYVTTEAEVSTSAVDGRIFFTANDGIHGSELWMSNVTRSNTKLYADVAPGAAWSSPKYLQIIGDKLFFTAYNKTDWQLYAVKLTAPPPPDNGYVPFKQGEWLQTFGSKNYPSSGYFNLLEGLATDSKKNVYLSGHFLAPDNDVVFFDSDTIAKGNAKYTNYTYKDYLVKLAPDGSFRWYKNNGGSDFFAYNALAVDKNDEVVVGGGASAPVVFDSTVINGQEGVYLAKYDTSGNTKWFKIFRSGRLSNIHHVITNSDNSIIVGGVYKNGFIDMGNGKALTSLYSGQYFVAKTNTGGVAEWAANIPVYIGYEGFVKKIITDGSANVYVLTTLFKPNSSANGCISDTVYIQITKLSNTGKILWNKKFNAVGVINAMSLTVDAAGLLNVTGYYAGQAFIDRYSLQSGFDPNCTKNEIIQVQMKMADGAVLGVGRFENQNTNIIDIKTNADGTYYVLGYKINPVVQPKIPGFENAPYSSPTRQLVLQHRFYNGQLIKETSWNVGSETIFPRSFFTLDANNDFLIATCGARYIDTFANAISNYNINISVWRTINNFVTPEVTVVNTLNEIRVLNNPSNSNVILMLPGTGFRGELAIYNAMGQLVRRQLINTASSIINIDVSSFSAGIYIISLPVGNKMQSVKILKH